LSVLARCGEQMDQGVENRNDGLAASRPLAFQPFVKLGFSYLEPRAEFATIRISRFAERR
ncbi:hypothetical protein, partial [Proteus mirabilis]|uniref:hypothetical protein n=1 Tax=Proteus mirabilis TaxID=584 RepID=UPI001EF7FFC0